MCTGPKAGVNDLRSDALISLLKFGFVFGNWHRSFNAMPGPARLITLNLGSQTFGLAEFRVAHGGLVLVNYRLRETPFNPETGERRDAHSALNETAAVLREMMCYT